MTTWTDRLARTIDWFGSDEWKWFVFPDILFVLLLIAFLLVVR